MEYLKNNALGVLGTIVGLLGIILSVYFYTASKQSRELAFIAGPNHTIFSGNTSFFDPGIKIISSSTGKEIDSNIYLNEITIWNNGNSSIRKSNILKPLKINYPHSTRVIGAFVIEQTRQDILNANVIFTENSNSLIVSADIMEPGDGFKTQVVYASNEPKQASLEGTIEGVKNFDSEENITNANLVYGIGKLIIIIFLILAVFLAIALLISGFEWSIQKFFPKKSEEIIRKLGSLISYSWIFFLIVIIVAFMVSLAYSFADKSAKESLPRMKTVRAELAPSDQTDID